MANDGSINLGNANGGGTGTPYTLSGELEPGNLTEGLMTFAEFSLEGATDDGRVLPEWTLDGAAESGNAITGNTLELTLSEFTLAGGMADGVALPAFTLDGAASSGALITGSITVPALEVSGSLEPALPLPEFSLDGVLLGGAVAVGTVALDAFTLTGTFGHHVDVELPELVVEGAALTGRVGEGSLSLPQLTASGVVFQSNSMDGEITLGIYSVDAAGSGVAVIDGAVTLSPFTLAAASSTGIAATADLTIPLYALDGQMGFSNVGTATITLPAFVLAGGVDSPAGPVLSHTPAAGTAGAVATVIALNTRLKGVSLYEGVEANSFANFAGITLAATPQGIVALRGDDDMGAIIEATITSGISDFALPSMKQVLTAYVGYRASGELSLTLITDEHHEYDYILEPVQSGDDLHASRVKFGRGVSGRFWQWTMANNNGEAFDLSSLEFHIQPTGRGV